MRTSPPRRPIDHLRIARRKNNARTLANRRMILASRLVVDTDTLPPLIVRIINQGTPNPNKMSKMLEPTALLTAMSPLPCLATMLDEIRSGIDVPIASMVRAMTAAGICRVWAMTIADSTNV